MPVATDPKLSLNLTPCVVLLYGGGLPLKEDGLLVELVQKLAQQAWLGQGLYVCQRFSEGDCVIVSALPEGQTKHIAALNNLSVPEQSIQGQ